MIVVEEPGALLLVTQPDHARFAAQLLSLWRPPEVSEHPRRELLLAAVREHDNGWREADAAPRIDPAGRPYDFRLLPDEHRHEIWRRGVRRFADEEPYIALLAAHHSWELHRDHSADPAHLAFLERLAETDPHAARQAQRVRREVQRERAADPRWTDYLRELSEQRAELMTAASISTDELARDYHWLQLADILSLLVCCRSDMRLARRAFSARMIGDELEIDPFPLAGATTFEIPARRIPNRRYRGEADLAGALGAARWTRVSVRCRPGAGAPSKPCR